MRTDILEFYKRTSLYTDLGFYKDFMKSLPDDISELCLLQRHQIIHPFDLTETERKNKNSVYGDMTKVDKTSLRYENDMFPTAISMIAELLRRNPNYSVDRKIEDKIHVCCREQALLLTATLKAKGIPARCRSGFAPYLSESDSAGDHWITEYYNEEKGRWVLVDSDMFFFQNELKSNIIDFDLTDIPIEKFIFGAEAYLKLRNNELKENEIHYASAPRKYGLKGALKGLFFDFHSLMNNEIIFLHTPKYIQYKNFELSEEEYKELDELARLMINPDENFDKLLEIWKKEDKYRIMSGGLNS
ncbi:MAG: transglutaminase domain-containing protein [Clostridia bacterium]|nr:transglutaminase domain-containing protein [Clostridia bacterium]